MAFSASCCLNLHPPPPEKFNSPSHTNKNQLVLWGENEGSWRKRCAVGMWGIMVAVEMGNSWVGTETAIALDSRNDIIKKWSDERRICPQWRRNSLETLMPEKLPRPASRRRWEAVRLSHTAPSLHQPIHEALPNTPQCFTM